MSGACIYYFSGTGNSLYLATELQKRLPGAALTPAVSILSQQTIVPEHKTIGLCFPNYAGHLPIPMKQLLRRLKLEGDEYIFAVANSWFSRCHAEGDIDSILARSGSKLAAMFNIIMPNNYPNNVEYEVPTEEEVQSLVSTANAYLDTIAQKVFRREKNVYADSAPNPFPMWMDKTLIPLLQYVAEHYPALINRGTIYATSQCRGCGVCEQVCPSSRIAVTEGRPEWDEKITCYGCAACLNFCPTAAVQLASKWFSGTSYTMKNGRYPHPFASADDIARQKACFPSLPRESG